jgi:dienelactone hydrolase
MKQLTSILSALLAGVLIAQAKLHTEVIEYKQGDTTLKGYLAYDTAHTGKRPGVLVVLEWWGLNDYTRSRSDQLAKLGYIAFAVDMYGNGVATTDPKEAAALAGKLKNDRALMRERVKAGLDVLLKQTETDPKRVAAIGYCFGGTTVLELARSGADIAGVVSFHGGLDTPNPGDAKNIKCRVLVLHGADDPFEPTAQVLDFQKEMKDAKVNWQMNFYGGAVHGFTNPNNGSDPSKGVAYNKQADQRSWNEMKLFFAEIFGQ